MLRNKLPYKYLFTISAIVFAALLALPVKAQGIVYEAKPAEETTDSVVGYDDDSAFFVNSVSEDVRQSALDAILPSYSDWTTAQLNGSLKLKGLPITPSVKIFMEKGKKISISIRASFLGEVGRIEVAGDSILAVNKMKRTYCSYNFRDLTYDYPGIVSDVQSLLLDRVVIPQAGELNANNADFIDINLGGSEEIAWILDFPKGLSSSTTMGMRYAINANGLISELIGFMMTSDHENVLDLGYSYRPNGYDMSITFIKDEKAQFSTVVNFDAVQWGAAEPAPIQLNSKFKRMDINNFIRSFKF